MERNDKKKLGHDDASQHDQVSFIQENMVDKSEENELLGFSDNVKYNKFVKLDSSAVRKQKCQYLQKLNVTAVLQLGVKGLKEQKRAN